MYQWLSATNRRSLAQLGSRSPDPPTRLIPGLPQHDSIDFNSYGLKSTSETCSVICSTV